MKGERIPDEDHIARYCPFNKLSDDRKPQATAFMLRPPRPDRPDDKSLSVNWLEFLNCPNRDSEITEIRSIYSSTFRRVGSKAKIAVLNVGEVCTKVLKESPDNRNLEVLHDPQENDQSHSGIYNLRQNDEAIAELIRKTVLETCSAR